MISSTPAPLSPPARASYDVVVVGGGHNGLVAAAYLARAGRDVLVLEKAGHTGGAAVSLRPFAGMDARLSAYSYLVSLLPRRIVDDLGLRFAVRRRAVSSYTPVVRDGRHTGLLVGGDEARTRASFAELTGGNEEFEGWRRLQELTAHVAGRVFPTLTEPLPTPDALRRRVDHDEAWQALFVRPVGELLERHLADDVTRGIALTDALIGTLSHAHDPSLLQNRCFLYHVIGGGTGEWNVPVGGMGALTSELARAAREAGAEIRTGYEATRVAADGRHAEVDWRGGDGGGTVGARYVLAGASAHALAALTGDTPPEPAAGSQLKINMLLRRLPRLKDPRVSPEEAFAGTFHIAEGYEQLDAAYRQARAGTLPALPPAEVYCHSLTDPTILGPDLAASGHHTLTVFGLLAPHDAFGGGRPGPEHERAKADFTAATLAQLDTHLAEPIAGCLALDAEGRPCVEAKTPVDLESELALPGGHIFHGDLSFPWRAEDDASPGGAPDEAALRWGVGTRHANVLRCGSSAVRGGGVSGVPGHNAAMAVLESAS